MFNTMISEKNNLAAKRPDDGHRLTALCQKKK
jgi:hypothetical protein